MVDAGVKRCVSIHIDGAQTGSVVNDAFIVGIYLTRDTAPNDRSLD